MSTRERSAAPAAARANYRPADDPDLRLMPEDLDLSARTRRLWQIWAEGDRRAAWIRLVHSPVRAILYRLISRAERRSDPLEHLARLVVWAARSGYPEAVLRMPARLLDEVVDELSAGAAHRTLDELDLLEDQLESEENHITLRRRIEGDTPVLLRQAAEINRAEAQVQQERARQLEREARRCERAALGALH